jgi:plasmid stability protein
MTITLKPETEHMLRARAASSGQDVDQVADELIRSALVAETQRTVREALVSAKPLDQVTAEARAKHGFPDEWATETYPAMTEADWAEVEAAHEPA